MALGCKKIIFGLIGLGFAVSARSNIEDGKIDAPLTPSLALPTASTEQRLSQLRENLAQVQTQLKGLKVLARDKSRAYHELSNAQAEPLYLWQEATHDDSRKALVLKLASLDLKQLIKKIETFESRREEISFELEWLGMEPSRGLMSEAANPKSAASKKSLPSVVRRAAFACNTLPVEALDGEKAQIVQPFGETRDPESGIRWQSSGWWVQRLKADVHACAPGKVAFSGKIPGRGSVVLVDHGQGVISLYANLLDGDLPLRGSKVESGTKLGVLKDKFYFEIRRDGLAIDPRLSFAPDRLAKFVDKL